MCARQRCITRAHHSSTSSVSAYTPSTHQRQKRPNTKAKETQYQSKRDPTTVCQKRRNILAKETPNCRAPEVRLPFACILAAVRPRVDTLCVCVCVCARARARVRACMRAHARDTHTHKYTQVYKYTHMHINGTYTHNTLHINGGTRP